MDPFDTFRLLLDEYSSRILQLTSPQAMNAIQLTDELGIPIAACYRRIRALKDGVERWWHDKFSIVRGPEGRPELLQGVVLDITERKGQEKALRDEANLLTRAMGAAGDGIWDWDKDYTDLELAIRHAGSLGVHEILMLGALGKRWDQTLANLLLPAAEEHAASQLRLLDGAQEVLLLRGGSQLTLHGRPGDTVSLIPLGGEAHGITTQGLEYPLRDETLHFGTTRGVSNTLLSETASVQLEQGILLCVLIHGGHTPE